MVRTLSRGAANRSHLLRGELPPVIPSLFEEKVHKKKLQRADCIPSSFQGCYAKFGALGISSEPQLERKRICREPFTLDKWNNMTAYKVDQPEQPQPAARRASPRHIPESCSEMAAIRACQEQMLATQAQQAAILRQLQVHFDLPQAVEPSTSTPAEPHSHPSESHPPEPQAPADAPTEEADPSA
ncbi:hypothetical protein CK203_060373 [Vitis vinifera]|uniref:Uncharacterized protein n=1 Tax=Vitis vinifera TaxID=29760 RepID=A0A438FSD5_VITVI|nr:hypothetical protein CK203_060373 [Vitis vinifera]